MSSLRLVWMCCVLTLAACSGGGSDGQAPQEPANRVSALQAATPIDAGVPQDYVGKIAEIISPIDGGSVGSGIKIPSASGGETMVYAVDANNNILLASMAVSAQTPLNADSTALALARIVLGALPASVKPSDVNAAIRAAQEYPNLVAQVSDAIAHGISPANSDKVFSSLSVLVPQISGAVLSASPGARASSVRAMAAPVVQPSVTTPLPYAMLSPFGSAYQGVFVTGASLTKQGNVNLVNTMSIAWSVASSDTDGNFMCPPGQPGTSLRPDCPTSLGRMGLVQQLVLGSSLNKLIGPVFADGLSTSVVGNGNAFNLTLKQDAVSRATNAIYVATDVTQLVIAALTAGSANAIAGNCVNALIDTILPAEDVAALVLEPTSDSLMKYLKGLAGVGGIYNIYGSLSTCLQPTELPMVANSNLRLNDSSSKFWRATVNFVTGFGAYSARAIASAVGQVASSAGIGFEIGLLINYWNYEKKFGVCEAVSVLGPNVVANCADSFKFLPTSLNTKSGVAVKPPVLSAYDRSGALTLTPSDMVYVSDKPSVVSVDVATGALTVHELPVGVLSETINITVTEQSTGINGSYTILVGAEGFTKISAAGKDLPADATTWSCVRHNATGLLWEAHVTRQVPVHPCAWDANLACAGYTNFGDGRAFDASTVPATVGSLCGKSGWRLPTEAEGRALVGVAGYVGQYYGTFQATWFGTDDTAYGGFTSSPVAGDPDYTWGVSFYLGEVSGKASVRYGGLGYYNYGYGYSVRLVAGP